MTSLQGCDLIEKTNIIHYMNVIFPPKLYVEGACNSLMQRSLTQLRIDIKDNFCPCEFRLFLILNYLVFFNLISFKYNKKAYPNANMNESYTLKVANLMANSVWGALRGMDTFSQLTYFSADTLRVQKVFAIYLSLFLLV